jgi:hypothetical protein
VKITKEKVFSIEHSILLEQNLSATFGLPDASNTWLEAYICGVVDMTQAIIEALEDEEEAK